MKEPDSPARSNWSEGPRPSFFGQLLTGGRPASNSSEGDTVWAEPLEPSPETDYERVLAQEREAYVKRQFSENFAADFLDRLVLAISVTLLMATINWSYIPKQPLLLWVLARSLLAAVRIILARHHVGRHAPTDTGAQQLHLQRMKIQSGLSGIVLGSSVLLFFGRIPIGLQYLCWMLLAGAVTLPLHGLALDPARMRAFVNSLFLTLLACMFYRIRTVNPQLEADVLGQHYEAWFVLLPLVHWVMVLYIAKRVRLTARKAFELEFYKQSLIDTLAKGKRQAEQAVQIKNRFLATAAHDMRQPVMALAIYAEHLQQQPDDRDWVVPKIAKATAAVNRLFDSLFDLARMDNEQLKPRIEALDIAEVMQDLRDQFGPIAKVKGVELRMRTARQEVRTDPVLLRRLIGNIISNAVKFTPEGKKVLIAARARATCTLVEVWDQGPGIASDELSKVFLEFYKIEGPSKSAEGFGLGLSIVARLAHALDVHVNVRSRLGNGTVFRLVVNHSPQKNGRRQNV